jgi:hypothetical protein
VRPTCLLETSPNFPNCHSQGPEKNLLEQIQAVFELVAPYLGMTYHEVFLDGQMLAGKEERDLRKD